MYAGRGTIPTTTDTYLGKALVMPKKKLIHGIDLTAPGGLAALFAFRRAQFGDAVMELGAGEGGAPAAPAAGDPAGTPPADPAGTPPGEPEPKAEAPAAPAAEKVEDLPDWAQKQIRDLRKTDGDERIAAKQLAAIQKALNPDAKDDEKPDPVKLAADLADRDTAARAAQTELAVYKLASKNGADADALLDSRAFLTKIADIDHTDTAKVTKAITDAINTNPKLKAVRAAGQSGGDFSGGSGENRTKKSMSLAEATANHYGTK